MKGVENDFISLLLQVMSVTVTWQMHYNGHMFKTIPFRHNLIWSCLILNVLQSSMEL